LTYHPFPDPKENPTPDDEPKTALVPAIRRAQRDRGGSASVVPPPTPAPYASAAPLAEVALDGTWRGELRFYPNGPTTMALRLERRGEDVTGHLDLDFASPEQADESFDVTDLRIGERELTFGDPKGIDDLVIAFRGVSTRGDELCGTADATLIEPEPPNLRILGSWCVRREAP